MPRILEPPEREHGVAIVHGDLAPREGSADARRRDRRRLAESREALIEKCHGLLLDRGGSLLAAVRLPRLERLAPEGRPRAEQDVGALGRRGRRLVDEIDEGRRVAGADGMMRAAIAAPLALASSFQAGSACFCSCCQLAIAIVAACLLPFALG
jgi:hypothetical protein